MRQWPHRPPLKHQWTGRSQCVLVHVYPDPVSDAGVQYHRKQRYPAADHLHPGEHPGGPAHVWAALRPTERTQRTGELHTQTLNWDFIRYTEVWGTRTLLNLWERLVPAHPTVLLRIEGRCRKINSFSLHSCCFSDACNQDVPPCYLESSHGADSICLKAQKLRTKMPWVGDQSSSSLMIQWA